jgi:amino acid adenylation domain-containing protein
LPSSAKRKCDSPALPLTPNGKLDRNALPEPDLAALAMSGTYQAPIGAIEQAIATIWQDLLGIDQVGRHDRFFELGGHSLLAVSLIERLRRLNLHADVRTVFAAPSLREMADAIGRAAATHVAFEVPPNRIPPGGGAITPDMLPLVDLTQAEIDRITAAVPGGAAGIQDIYPLAPLQEGILFHHLLGHEGDAYLVRSLVAFDDHARLEAFLAALQAVIDRHDILRSAVHWSGLPHAVQIVQRSAPLPVHTLTLPPDGDALDHLKALTDPRRLRLDLRRAPLLAAYIAPDPQSGRWLLSLLDHHMVSDHVTLEIVLEEIHAILRGQQAALPAALPYRDFIAHTRATPPEAHEAYFRRALEGIDEPTAPFGLHDVQGDGVDVDETTLPLDDQIAQRLREQARSRGITPAVLFHVAWAQVLARCTGRSDVVFGTVLSGRLQGSQGADRALGVFINTLPVRIPLDGRSVSDTIQHTSQNLQELLAHEQAPLALAQRCSQMPHSTPLFTTLLNYRHQTGGLDAVPQFEGAQILTSAERTNYPITLSIEDYGEAFSLTVQVISPAEPLRVCALMQRALEELADALSHAPECMITGLDVLPPAERELLLHGWNRTEAPFPAELCIHHLFERQARATPDAIALADGSQTISYGELDARANLLCHRLVASGVEPDDRVAICVERGPLAVIGLLAILKAAAAYVPLDTAYPIERLGQILQDAHPRLLLHDARGRQALGAHAEAVRLLDLDDPATWANADQQPDIAVRASDPRSLAYLIYTSGSTGTPKGVMIEHRGLVASTMARHEFYRSGTGDRFMLLSSIAFDSSVAGIFGTLTSGGTLFIPDQNSSKDPQAIVRLAVDHAITTMLCVPSLGRLIVGGFHASCNRALRELIVAGEPCPPTLAAECAACVPPVTLYNEYGPTEATVWATVHRCLPDERGPVPIGKPIRNTQLYVLDGYGMPVPLGVAGELHIGGAGVARGYLNRPELSAERFVSDPFGPGSGGRLYRTGDLARYRPDGSLDFLGRNDQQVKIRGFRVELGEIESCLVEHPAVREAVLIAREDDAGATGLVAYLIQAAGAGPEAPGPLLRSFLKDRLPVYMIPAAFVVLDAFPLTPNGKLDRPRLPPPDSDAFARQQYLAPQGETERRLSEIWTDLLHVEGIGRNDDFFELGGHSLLAVQLAIRMRDMFDVDVSMKVLFDRSSLSALAGMVDTMQLASYEIEELARLERELGSMSESELLAILSEEAPIGQN